MREFLAPRRSNSGLMAQSPFQHLPKDDALSAIMARRREIADSGKEDISNTNGKQRNKTSSELQPKSNLMTISSNSNASLDHKRSDHSRNSISSEGIPRSNRMTTSLNKGLPLDQTRSEHSRNSASSDFRPRSNRMTAALNNAKNSDTASLEQKRSDHSRNETPNELLMAISKRRTKVDDTSIPIVSPRRKNRHENYKHVPMSPMLQDKLDRQRNMVENVKSSPPPKSRKTQAKKDMTNDEEQSIMSSITSMTGSSVRHASFPSVQRNENDESSSESSVSHKFYSDTDNKVKAHIGSAFMDEGYQSTSDESGAQLANIILAHHRRSPKRELTPSATSSYDESGPTFANENNPRNAFHAVSDEETDDDPFENAAERDGSFYCQSTSGTVSDSENYDEEENEAVTDDEVDQSEASDIDMMSNDNTYEEETVDEEFLVDEDDVEEQLPSEEQTVYENEVDLFQNARNDEFGQPQQFDDILDEELLDLEQENSIGQTSENREEKSSVDGNGGITGSCSPSSKDDSTENDEIRSDAISADVFGGKIVDGRVDRDVPLGDDDSSYDLKENTTLTRDSATKKYNKNRVCSWTVVIGLVLIGSIAIGAGIGVFFSKKSSDDTSTSGEVVDEPKPAVNVPNASQVPPENAAIYNIICPKLIECAGLLDKQSAQGRAFDWIVNKTANPQLDEMADDAIIRRYALATIYYSTEGDSWVDNTNWLSSANECDWFSSSESGSGCGIEGQTMFSTLELDNNNVTGQLPYELSLLSTVSKISIRNPVGTDPYLQGTIPSQVGKLTSMTSLSLSGNQFSSGIPIELGNCVNLATLDLSENGLNGELPTSISSLTNLTTFNLEGNFFTGRVDSTIFEGLKGLIDLNLKRNRLTGIPETIHELKHLQQLNLASNDLSVVPLAITLFEELSYLDLSGNGFTGTIPFQIGTMSTLTHLDLSDNTFSGMIPPELGNLVNLETVLDLSFNVLIGPIPSRFGQLVELQHLRLDGNRLSGTIPTDLAALTKIEEIRFDDNGLTGAVPPEICTWFEKERPASYADCNELLNATCITHCCTMDGGCLCQFEKTDPLLCIRDPI